MTTKRKRTGIRKVNMRLSNYLKIGSKLKQARKKVLLSQREMATKLGLSFSRYSNYENGHSEPPMDIILQLCNVCGITVEEFLDIVSPSPNTITLPLSCSFESQERNSLVGKILIDMSNPQIATFINSLNQRSKQVQLKVDILDKREIGEMEKEQTTIRLPKELMEKFK